MTVLNISHATTGLTEAGVIVDDPGAPYRVIVSADRSHSVPVIARLSLELREHDLPPSRAEQISFIAGLPVRDIMRAAVALQFGSEHANETYYRSLVASGADRDYAILTVASWAREVDRPGGASGAIAEFWGVSQRTAFRWLARARASAPAPAEQPPADHRQSR